jgi:resuscitation-promoting factor RpfA
VRYFQPLSLAGLAALVAFALAGAAFAQQNVRPADPPVNVRSLRSYADHYRELTWTYERAARLRRTPSSLTYRRSADPAYLQWTIDTWTRRAYQARRRALTALERTFAIDLPAAPSLHARLQARVGYSRRLALKLRGIYPGKVTRAFASARGGNGGATLRLWQERSADSALAVALHAARASALPAFLERAFRCIHRHEGSWTANTGNGYYGGLQMDRAFQGRYGAEYVRRWGTADRWPAWAQLHAGARAYRSGRGFGPWPNTARACGLL